MKEVSLGLIKPYGGYENKDKILSMIESNGLEVPFIKDPYLMTRAQAEHHYAEKKGMPFYDKLIEMMISRPSVLFLAYGENAIERFRDICGKTDPAEAAEGTIRSMFGSKEYMMHNVIHASDSQKAAKREIEIHLRPEEMLELPRGIREILDRTEPYKIEIYTTPN